MDSITRDRVASLDVFRGITIAAMVLVNTPGSWSHIYAPLRHSAWHGFTPTDLVFPFFLFAIGTSMSFSFLKYQDSSRRALIKILRRTLLILIIAYLVKWFPFTKINFETMRIMGVLQRIALAYCFGAFICYFLDAKRILYLSAGILLGYWALLYFFGTGDPYSLQGNLVLKIDKLILGESHLWKGLGTPFDPEGLLSTLPAIISITSGYLTGFYIQKENNQQQLLNYLFICGNGLIVLALFWDRVFPINKSLWTSSYVLMSSGIAVAMVAFLIFIIDFKKFNWWVSPFKIMGENPLVLYVLSILIVKVYFMIPTEYGNAYSWIYNSVFVPIAGDLNGSLLFALTHVALIGLFGWFLHKRGIIIKV